MALELSLLEQLKSEFMIGEQDAKAYSPLVLAYIGDCVYELIVRTVLVSKRNVQVQKLHREATWFVKAATQATIVEKLQSLLEEDELDIYRRGKNAKSHTAPKNANLGEYHKATGFEAIIGYLFLQDKTERIIFLVKEGLNDEFEKEV